MENTNENTEFYDGVLIKLHRKYGKDELVSSLTKNISEKDVEIGKLKSYIDELIDIIKTNENKYKEDRGNFLSNPNNFVNDKDFTYIRNKVYEQMKLQIKKQNRIISNIRTTNRELITKLLKSKNHGK